MSRDEAIADFTAKMAKIIEEIEKEKEQQIEDNE